MARDMAQLKEIARQLVRRLDDEHPGCGAVLILFDARGPADRKVALHLQGINEIDAVKQMLSLADVVWEAASQGDTGGDLIHDKPLIIKPTDG